MNTLLSRLVEGFKSSETRDRFILAATGDLAALIAFIAVVVTTILHNWVLLAISLTYLAVYVVVVLKRYHDFRLSLSTYVNESGVADDENYYKSDYDDFDYDASEEEEADFDKGGES